MSFAYKVSAFNRRRKWEIFMSCIKPTREMRVLDVGFSENEYSANDNFIEKNYPYPEMLTALGVDDPNHFKERYPKVKAVKYDGSNFPFENKQFDVLWSNAVIEHVGDRDKQLVFLAEAKRVAKHCFLTTPNRHFPIEVHTRIPLLHFLPKRIFDEFLKIIGKRWATGDYMHLLSYGDLTDLLSKAGIDEYKIIRNRFLGFTMDFVVVF